MNLGIYIHIPFCEIRCPYCDFVTTDRGDLHRKFRHGYVDVLRKEWRLWCERWSEIKTANLRSIFMGGGTPNLLNPEEVRPLLREIMKGVPDQDDLVEITAEMNPGHTSRSAMEEWRAIGINRVSLGVQSTRDNLLQTLGRNHSAAEAYRAYQSAREAGFDNLNIDQIFAIPGQTLEDWKSSLLEIVDWGPDHISAYNLTSKDQTPLAVKVRAGELVLPDEEAQVEMFNAAHRILTQAGYAHYEISNYARPGKESRHNGDVWRGDPYIGLGLGAHSCWGGERLWNTASWEEYHREIGSGQMASRQDTARTPAGEKAEKLYLGLRTREGISTRGLNKERVHALCEEGLAERENGTLKLTLSGWAVADAVVGHLL